MSDPFHFSDPFWDAPPPAHLGYVNPPRRVQHGDYLSSRVLSQFSSFVPSGQAFPVSSAGVSYCSGVAAPLAFLDAPQAVSGTGDSPLQSSDQTVGVKFKVGGLATVSVRCTPPARNLSFRIGPEDSNAPHILRLNVTEEGCTLEKLKPGSHEYELIPEHPDPRPDVRERPVVIFPKAKASASLNRSLSDKTTFWISVDRSNARVRYGQHLTNNSMTFMEALFDPSNAEWMADLKYAKVYRDEERILFNDIRLSEVPVTTDLPPLVVPQDQITLEQLENCSAMTWASLPKGCQKLYHNISGPNITARPISFPGLPEVIERSCNDSRMLCQRILNWKAQKSGNKEETYLRITVGDNLANSPGIPYVMEIWPPGHSSPIHKHGDASAVIKVLYGSVEVTWYDALQNDRRPNKINHSVLLSEGDVTWLGKEQYQIHRLENTTDKVCITLQCYQFEEDDTIHDETFQWIDKDDKLKKIVPGSDMAYGVFVEKMKTELANGFVEWTPPTV